MSRTEEDMRANDPTDRRRLRRHALAGCLLVGGLVSAAPSSGQGSAFDAYEQGHAVSVVHLTAVEPQRHTIEAKARIDDATVVRCDEDVFYATLDEIIRLIDEMILVAETRLTQCESAGACGIDLGPIASVLDQFVEIIEASRVDPPEELAFHLESAASVLREADSLIRKSSHRGDERLDLRYTALCRLSEARALLHQALATFGPSELEPSSTDSGKRPGD